MCNIRIDWKKGILGLLLGLAAGLLGIKYSAPITGAVLGVCFLLVGSLRITVTSRPLSAAITAVWSALMLLATWFSTLTVINSVKYLQTSPYLFFLNALCMLVVCGVLFLLCGKPRASVTAASVALAFLTLANGLVYQFRGKELLASDVFSFATALNVADQYTAVISSEMFFGWAVFALVLFLQFTFPPVRWKLPARTRALTGLVALIACVSLSKAIGPIKTELWDTRGSVVNGYYLNFLLSIRDSSVKKPQEYDADLLGGSFDPPDLKDARRPNIIVIMNEAFTDPRVFGEVNTNTPFFPYFDKLKSESIHGWALASVFGGNTANSEFEFLTGHTMAFLPPTSVAYQQFVHGKIFVLPRLLNAYGYESIATHPYYANGWSRKKLYPEFGFVDATFLDSYPQKNLLRTYVSDQEMYEFMLEKIKAPRENPLFFFGVSMQNHGGYDYTGEDFVNTVSLTDYPDLFPRAEQYLSTLHASDKALEFLIESLRDFPEDTILLLFGDHQPWLEGEFYESIGAWKLSGLEKTMTQYTVPFFIWANYDISPEEIPLTGINYLPHRLLTAAGLPLSPYYESLRELEQIIPALNPYGYYSKEAQGYLPLEDAAGAEKNALDRLAILQYNNLFDPAHRSYSLFGQFIPQ
ncbi:MAG: LTA synthase family protein [Oscillospiraceae bacterium]|nr:LTA synthase family protein [Oscillospiraceae bacterium]